MWSILGLNFWGLDPWPRILGLVKSIHKRLDISSATKGQCKINMVCRQLIKSVEHALRRIKNVILDSVQCAAILSMAEGLHRAQTAKKICSNELTFTYNTQDLVLVHHIIFHPTSRYARPDSHASSTPSVNDFPHYISQMIIRDLAWCISIRCTYHQDDAGMKTDQKVKAHGNSHINKNYRFFNTPCLSNA